MKNFLVFLFCFGFTVFSSAHETFIRVRMFKDLAQFPVIARAHVKLVSPSIWKVFGKNLNFNKKELSNTNYVFKKSNNKFDIVSRFEMNGYLAGVVAKEMPLAWPIEALKAQAVIARSYALAKMSKSQNRFYHLDANQMDQVFAVTDSKKAQLAVFLTDQIVLKDNKNKVLMAYYHADCGGHTIPAGKVWPGAIDAGTAADPWCQKRKTNEWFYEISKGKIASDLNLEESWLVEDRYQKRIQSVRVHKDVISVQKLRQLFGYGEIKNSPLAIRQFGGKIHLKGKGFGHGVGLCQWGAHAQVLQGLNYQQILAHYYPRAHLVIDQFKLSKSFLSVSN